MTSQQLREQQDERRTKLVATPPLTDTLARVLVQLADAVPADQIDDLAYIRAHVSQTEDL